MIDISGGSKNPIAARLSNFTLRTFEFDGVLCISIEGVLQSFKFAESHQWQRQICSMVPKKAKERGTAWPVWKVKQKLNWFGREYNRHSHEYQVLLARLYDSVYDQDPRFKDDLLALGAEDIAHSIGTTDPYDTVLTEAEFTYQLNRLRKRAQTEI